MSCAIMASDCEMPLSVDTPPRNPYCATPTNSTDSSPSVLRAFDCVVLESSMGAYPFAQWTAPSPSGLVAALPSRYGNLLPKHTSIQTDGDSLYVFGFLGCTQYSLIYKTTCSSSFASPSRLCVAYPASRLAVYPSLKTLRLRLRWNRSTPSSTLFSPVPPAHANVSESVHIPDFQQTRGKERPGVCDPPSQVLPSRRRSLRARELTRRRYDWRSD